MAMFGRKVRSIEQMSEDELISYISEKSGIKDGSDEVKKILVTIKKYEPVSTRKLSSILNLPLPVIAHVRKELEKLELLKRDISGAVLTRKGKKLVSALADNIIKESFICPKCSGKGVILLGRLKAFFSRLESYQKRRPPPKHNIDQFYATTKTSCLRAALMYINGDIEGKDIIFLGDDDLTSVCVASLGIASSITVIDIDKTVLDTICRIAANEGFYINTIDLDLRYKTPNCRGDIVVTDPPYTEAGLRLFLERAYSCGDIVYLSFSRKPAGELLSIERYIVNRGFLITAMYPGFNEYQSMGTFGGRTYMIRLQKVGAVTTDIQGRDDNIRYNALKIYTGEENPVIRHYICLKCNKEYIVGHNRNFTEISRLKKVGCRCGGKKFKLVKRKKVKNSGKK